MAEDPEKRRARRARHEHRERDTLFPVTRIAPILSVVIGAGTTLHRRAIDRGRASRSDCHALDVVGDAGLGRRTWDRQADALSVANDVVPEATRLSQRLSHQA